MAVPTASTRSREQLALIIVQHALTNGIADDLEVPASLFRNDAERTIAESLTNAEAYAATAIVLQTLADLTQAGRAHLDNRTLVEVERFAGYCEARARFHAATRPPCAPRAAVAGSSCRPRRRRRQHRARAPCRRPSGDPVARWDL